MHHYYAVIQQPPAMLGKWEVEYFQVSDSEILNGRACFDTFQQGYDWVQGYTQTPTATIITDKKFYYKLYKNYFAEFYKGK